MWIDEAGRDDQVRCINCFLAAVGDFANLGDLAVLDCDVRATSKGAGAVDNRSVFDDEIVGHFHILRDVLRGKTPELSVSQERPSRRKDCDQGVRSLRHNAGANSVFCYLFVMLSKQIVGVGGRLSSVALRTCPASVVAITILLYDRFAGWHFGADEKRRL